jgi:cytochrome c oxidase subunit 1/cytochrome c oxidase subunit I+III
MHIAGLLGMPRRIYTYPADMGWNTVNLITSIGSFVFALGVLIFLVDLAWSYRRGPAAGDNPWDAPTLEWSIASPPPPYNFATIPFVGSRHPLWERRLASEQGDHPGSVLNEGYILDDGREALGTTALDGEPNIILKMPGDSYAPLFLGVFSTLVFAGMILHAWWFAAAMLVAAAFSVIAWLWPERGLLQREPFPVHDEGGEIG